MGAMLCTEEAARAFTPGMHGTTFGGGPLACAVANTVIDTMQQENTLAHVRDVGGYFKEQLQSLAAKHSVVVDVRGMGLMLGIELNSADLAKSVLQEMMRRRIIINRTSETVLRFLPPYILERKHVNIAVSALDDILRSATQAGAAVLAGEHANG
jgi:acetylornithine aminotransferase/acetylornithine/N-succinyldiaminopimelate aminotransferase